MNGKTSSTIGAKKEQSIIPDVLYDFSRAVMGNHCRTRPTLTMQGDNRGVISWLEAYQLRQGDWKLYRRSKTFSDFDATDETASFQGMVTDNHFTQDEILAEDKKDGTPSKFGMMDILYKMAEFENTAALNAGTTYDLNMLIEELPGHTIQDLGDNHYKAFGIRECIAFDEDKGLPVPSFEGHITGNGSFSDEQEQQILQAWQNKVIHYGKEGSYLDTLALNPKPVSMLEDIYHNLNRRKAYTEIINYFEENIFKTFRDIKQYGFAKEVELEREGRPNARVYIGEALAEIIAETFDDNVIERNFGRYLTPDDIGNIHKALMTMDIFRAIMHVRWAIDLAMQDPDMTEESEAFTKEQISEIQAKYKQYDLGEVDENLIMQSILDKNSEQAIEIESTIERIRNDLIALRDAAAQDAKDWQQPKTVNTPTAPKPNNGGA